MSTKVDKFGQKFDEIQRLSFRRRALGRDVSSNNILEHGIAAGQDGWLPGRKDATQSKVTLSCHKKKKRKTDSALLVATTL
ncbi:hypothetical protein KCU93_g302, partial [Aureobasidium melanogenum]